MRFIFFFLIILLLPTLTLADEGFWGPSELKGLPKPHNFDKAIHATVQISVANQATNVDFSGILVSVDGFVLTSAHSVFEICLKKDEDYVVEGALGPDGKNLGFLFETSRNPPSSKILPVVCNNLSLPGFSKSAPKVIYLGNGYVQMPPNLFTQLSANDYKKLLEIEDDFAVLKFDLSKKPGCLPLSPDPQIKPNQLVWTLGFPLQNQRPEGHASDGKSKLVSFGVIFKDLQNNDSFASNDVNANILRKVEGLYSPRSFFSNVDQSDGSSGGPMIDGTGMLVGIATTRVLGGLLDPAKAFIEDSTVSIKATAIRDEIQKAMGPKSVSQIFNCK